MQTEYIYLDQYILFHLHEAGEDYLPALINLLWKKYVKSDSNFFFERIEKSITYLLMSDLVEIGFYDWDKSEWVMLDNKEAFKLFPLTSFLLWMPLENIWDWNYTRNNRKIALSIVLTEKGNEFAEHFSKNFIPNDELLFAL